MWTVGLTFARLYVTVEKLLRLIKFLETMALWSIFPVGNVLEVTLTYCVDDPMMVAVVVREPNPIILAVP